MLFSDSVLNAFFPASPPEDSVLRENSESGLAPGSVGVDNVVVKTALETDPCTGN